MPPLTDVMPATTTMEKATRPRKASKSWNVTLPNWYASSDPPSPAMKAPMAKPMSLTRTTLMPAAAAERSSERTASMAVPRRLVRSQLTPNATRTSTTRHRIPKAGRGKSLPDPMPRFMPNSVGVGMFSPDAPPSMELLLNQMASTPAANVNVTTPSMSPRTRRAGMPITTPAAAATRAERIGAIGNGMPQEVANVLRM